ncbi:MAG: hypothetical protein ACTSWW_04280 [Promethearchaeota archaeon]
MERQILLQSLKVTEIFSNFVTKPEIEEDLQFTKNRTYILEKLKKALELNNPTRIIPITGLTGQGKSFVCWQIKSNLDFSAPALFMQVPSNPSRFWYDLYTKIFEEIGSGRLRRITGLISDRWGTPEMKFGMFRTTDTHQVLERAKESVRFRWSDHPSELEDCMKVIIAHAMSPEQSPLAERWLLGEIMDPEELFYLGIERNLSAPYMAEELFILVGDYISEGIILLYDDIDLHWKNFSGEEEIDYDDDWTVSSDIVEEDGALDENSPDNSDPNKIESIFQLFEQVLIESQKIKIVLTMQNENFQEIHSLFSEDMQPVVNQPIPLLNYSSGDTRDFYFMAMDHYRKINSLQPVKDDRFFPISDILMKRVFNCTEGNPREVIRACQTLFDFIVFDNLTPEQLLEEYACTVR